MFIDLNYKDDINLHDVAKTLCKSKASWANNQARAWSDLSTVFAGVPNDRGEALNVEYRVKYERSGSENVSF